MIKLMRLNKTEVVINADVIESVESTPDTIITLTTGNRVTVRESVEEVIKKCIIYKRTIALPIVTENK